MMHHVSTEETEVEYDLLSTYEGRERVERGVGVKGERGRVGVKWERWGVRRCRPPRGTPAHASGGIRRPRWPMS